MSAYDDDDKFAKEPPQGTVQVIPAPHDAEAQKRRGKLERGLSSRHITWIGFGGGIGVGLFVGIGQSLAIAGLLGILISFAITGFNVWCVLQSAGEVITQYPVDASFPGYATRFVDQALGFTVGWSYWYNNGISVAVEVSAVAVLFSFWTDVNPAVWISIGLVAIYLFNFLPVKFYGEAEFATASIKVITLLGLFICSLVITLGGAPDHHRRGFEYWRNPGALNTFAGIGGHLGQFLAVLRTLTNSAFAKQIPKNVKLFIYRQLFFYIGGSLLVGMIVPFHNPDLVNGAGNAASSPWVIAIRTAGISALPSIINAAIITSAFSAGNTYMYIGARTLRGMALNGMAPKAFARTTTRGVPLYAVLATIPLGMLAYLSCGSGGAAQAFDWLQAIIALNILLNWGLLCVMFLRYYAAMKAQGRSHDDLHWKSACQPYAAWFGCIFSFVVCLVKGFPVFLKGHWNTSDFIASYISFPVLIVPYVVWKLWKRPKFVKAKEADLDSDEIDPADIVEEKVPTSAAGRVFNKVFT